MTTQQQKDTVLILFLACVGIFIMAYLDAVAPYPYSVKAGGKAVLFFSIPFVYQYLKQKQGEILPIKTLFAFHRKPLILAVGLGVGVITVIWGSYFVLGSLVDLSAVTGELDAKMNINESNFIATALYIATCNSFLEEFFFRGFLFFRLKECVPLWVAHLLSATLFSLYHVAIMVTWFQWWVFLLCMVALVIGGVIFNLLDDGTYSLYPSWLTHACANLALNTIGLILFFG